MCEINVNKGINSKTQATVYNFWCPSATGKPNGATILKFFTVFPFSGDDDFLRAAPVAIYALSHNMKEIGNRKQLMIIKMKSTGRTGYPPGNISCLDSKQGSKEAHCLDMIPCKNIARASPARIPQTSDRKSRLRNEYNMTHIT